MLMRITFTLPRVMADRWSRAMQTETLHPQQLLREAPWLVPKESPQDHPRFVQDLGSRVYTRVWWVAFAARVMTIGRHTYNEVVLPLSNISGVHARLYRCHQQLYIEDMQSTNGTYINGFPLRRGNLMLIRPGDEVQLAGYPIEFQLFSCTDWRLFQARKANSESSNSGIPVEPPSS